MNKNLNIQPIANSREISINDFIQLSESLFQNLDIKQATKEDYLYRIPKFLKFLKEIGYHNDIYLEYKRYLEKDNTLGTSSKNKYLITAKIFLKELNRKGYINSDITQNIKGFKCSNKHKKQGVNDTEMKMILDYIQGLEATKENIRLRMIISFLALQGLRQIEVVRLDVDDIDLANNTALIKGKGSDDKEIIYLQSEVVKAIDDYLKVYCIKSGCLLPSTSNRNKGSRMSTRAFRGIVKNLLDNLEIQKSTHSFRHYFTTKLIDSYKGDLMQVRKYTRHKGLDMLQVYNDNIETKKDLPRFYKVFSDVKFI